MPSLGTIHVYGVNKDQFNIPKEKKKSLSLDIASLVNTLQ